MAYESDLYWSRRQADLVTAIDTLVAPHQLGLDEDFYTSPIDTDYSPLGSIMSMTRSYGALIRRTSSHYSDRSAASQYSDDAGLGSNGGRLQRTRTRGRRDSDTLPSPPRIIINDGVFGADFIAPRTHQVPSYTAQYHRPTSYGRAPAVDHDAQTILYNTNAIRHSRHASYGSNSSLSSDDEPLRVAKKLARAPTKRYAHAPTSQAAAAMAKASATSSNGGAPGQHSTRGLPHNSLMPRRRGAVWRRSQPSEVMARYSRFDGDPMAAEPDPIQAARGLRRKYSWER